MLPAPDSNAGQAGMVSCPFRHVLVGWDGSPDAAAALRTAVAIIGNAPGRVTALTVLPEPHSLEGGHDPDRTWEAFQSAQLAATEDSPARISRDTANGRNVAKAICDYATEHGFDLLVVGRHGDGGLLHPKLGHIAEATAKASSIPVLLVSAS